MPPPPPSKRRALAAEPISEGGVSLDEGSDADLEVSVAVDEPAPGADEGQPTKASDAEAPTADLTSAEREAAPDDSASPESGATKIRSVQQTVPGLSPVDALDSGWDAVASQIPAVEDEPVAPTTVSETSPEVDQVAKPSPSRAGLDVPTPIVPVNFDGTTRDSGVGLERVSQADGDEQTVVRTDAEALAASARKDESDENADRVLAPVTDEESDEQTVVRAEPATSPSDADEVLTSPSAAPPPLAVASPPPRIPVGSRRSAPPPPSRSNVPPPLRAPSLPPLPSLDKARGAAPPAEMSRPVPPPPRPSLPPPIARSASDGVERVSLEATPSAAPLLAPPSFAALSLPPPPPPAQSSKRPSVPPPPQMSKRPAVPPPAALAPPPSFPPAAQKAGSSENTPTIQVSTIAGRPSSADFTPTVQVQRASGALSGRPLPPPAPVPTFSGVPARAQVGTEPIRPKSSSIAPLVDSIPPPGSSPGTRRYLMALAALTFAVAAIFLGMRMRPGSVIVTVASESGGAVRDVVVKIDDVVRCHSTPCEVTGLEPGAHLVSASAAGLPAGAQRAFSVAAGERAAEHVSLGSAERARAELSVAGVGDGLHVFVDGRDLGAPPVVIRDIDPDTHIVRVTGPGQAYEPYQETVRLEAGEARSLGPVRLKLLRGKLELLPGDGADGAKITVDGRRVSHLPATLELSADQSHEVLAQRRGFADFSEEVVFDGAANRSLEVSLSPGTSSGASSDFERPRTSHVSSSTSAKHSSAPAAPEAGKTATLDVVSTPPSNVVINGRPMGSTPLRNVRVPAGPQTVVFVHASLGRKIASTSVAPGGHGSVGVKF